MTGRAIARATVLAIVLLHLLAPRSGSATSATHLTSLRWFVQISGGGRGALEKVRTLEFDFVVRAPGKPDMVFHHAYDADEGLYRYECSCADFARVPVWDETAGDRWQPAPNPPKGKRLVAIYRFPLLEGTVYIDKKALTGPEKARILRRVHSRVMNERAWMFLPLFVDSRTARARLVAGVEDPELGELDGFEVYWGRRGESDIYVMYLDAAQELVRTDFRLKHDLSKSTTVYWRDWKWYGPVRIAGERYLPGSGKRLLFENVRVNERVEIEAAG